MEKIILVVHVLTAIAIIGLILLQQGKGAEMGASFGAGASQTVFGSSGSGNFFTRTTAILAILFFSTSFGLAVVAKNSASVDSQVGIPALEKSTEPAGVEQPESDVPIIDGSREEDVSDIPVVDDSQDRVEGDIPSDPAEDEEVREPRP